MTLKAFTKAGIYNILLVLTLLIWIPNEVFSGVVNIDDFDDFPIKLDSSVYYFIDELGDKTLEEVLREEFTINSKTNINFGYIGDPVWLKFTIKNTSGETLKDLFFEVENSNLDYVNIYLYKSNELVKSFKTGDLLPFEKRVVAHPNFTVPAVEIGNGEELDFYAQLKTAGSTYATLKIWSTQTFIHYERSRQIIFGIYYGIMLIIVIYNTFLFFSLGDKSYLHYVFYIIGFNATIANINGFTAEYIFPNNPDLNNILLPVSCFVTYCFMMLFTKHFLYLKKNAPKLNNVLIILVVSSAALALATPIMGYYYSLRIATSLSIVMSLLIFISGTRMIKSYRPARYFVVAWTFFLFGIIMVSLRQWGVLPENLITSYSFQLGSALEAILLSVSLIDRIYVLKREKLDALNEVASKLETVNETKAFATRIKEKFDRVRDKEGLKAYYFIQTNLDKVEFISANVGIIEVFCSNGQSNMFDMPLKDIEIFFEKEELIRVRKNYFVNPNAVIGVNKISKNSYELLTRQKKSIPIGPTYLAKARSTFPQLFSAITK